jgi:hypothetical protein
MRRRDDFYGWLTDTFANAYKQNARLKAVRVSERAAQYIHPTQPDAEGRFWLCSGHWGGRVELIWDKNGWDQNRPYPVKRREA